MMKMVTLNGLVLILFLQIVTAMASPLPPDPVYDPQIASLRHRTVVELLLGAHGELFWMEDVNSSYLRKVRGFAARKEDGSGIEIVFERDRKFIHYADVSKDGSVTYDNTPEARALTGDGFCGITRWPAKEVWAKPPRQGEVQVFAATAPKQLPVKPKNCEGVAYALSDGAFLFCQPASVCSPYPLWLLRQDKRHLELVPFNAPETTLLVFEVEKGGIQITQFRDGWMRELPSPFRSPYRVEGKVRSKVEAPKRTIYISETYSSGQVGRKSVPED